LSKRINNNIKGILFDLDGTLIDSMNDHYYAWKKTFNFFLKINLKPEDFFVLEGMKLQNIILHFCKINNIDIKKINLKKILNYKEKIYLKKAKFKLYPYVTQSIKLLKKNNIKLGIVTSGLRKRLYDSTPSEFRNNFDVIVTGDDTILGKPSKQPYVKGLKSLNLTSKNCMVVENAPLGIKSAISADLFCIAIASTIDKKFLDEANVIVNSFEELYKEIIF
tara:strand:- start:900 stop:1562 length:663 start_codon:yes stop_codon:yes gene_type:complete